MTAERESHEPPLDRPGERRSPTTVSAWPRQESEGLRPAAASADVDLQVEERQSLHDRSSRVTSGSGSAAGDRLFFVAERQPDGTYGITLTEEGVQTFETALGIAHDLGGNTPISPHSTVADIMERTATREELSQLLRRGGAGLLHRIRLVVLRRKLRGSERPSSYQSSISHLGKVLIVAVIGLWALRQFAVAIQDIEDIPGILSNVPSDILHLHPTSAFDEVGNRIADAGQHVLFGVLVACLTYIAAKVVQPFGRIYRKDQLVPGERASLRLVNAALRKADGGSGGSP